MSTPFKIKGVSFWANLNKPNDLSGKYQVDIGHLSQAAIERLESEGIEVKEDDKGGDDNKKSYITCKSTYPIKVYTKEGDEIDVIVGNGSKVEAVINPYEWSFKNKKGVSPGILKFVVVDLNEYQSATSFEDLEEAL